jgi:hypothetical protein
MVKMDVEGLEKRNKVQRMATHITLSAQRSQAGLFFGINKYIKATCTSSLRAHTLVYIYIYIYIYI